MMEIIDRLWEKDEPKVFITKDQYIRGLDGWNIVGHEIEGELAFVTVTRGPQFHFQSFDTKKSLPLKRIRVFLYNIIAQHGYAETRTPHEDARQHRFNLLLGFEAVGRDEYDVIYHIKRIRGQCHSSP